MLLYHEDIDLIVEGFVCLNTLSFTGLDIFPFKS